MLKRLKFPEHGIDLAINTDTVLYVSLDSGAIEGVPRSYTTIVFNSTAESLTILSKNTLDHMQTSKLHSKILDVIFPTV